ncbi:hypothetical protein K2173_018250 [Erythroxylum novogranatense]|uniref:J domain-containing protein n=1 Tax=Erythroxylum novogranatense TaxID=1862640 RepID=A0AAV8UEM3_9ROSI|nr:hypothetical protein K2173_018250 [Erythroxylum novogranatense]
MYQGLVSTGSQTSFHRISRSNMLPSKSMAEPCSRLTFNTHLPNSIFSSEFRSRSFRTKPVEACTRTAPCKLTVNLYGLLGISESGTLLEIKQAYKQLARKYHPDVSPPNLKDNYTKRFIEVQEAYETLSDPDRRASYDRHVATGLHMALSTRTKLQDNEACFKQSEWRNQWRSQLADLQRRTMDKDCEENMSWAARIRRKRSQR